MQCGECSRLVQCQHGTQSERLHQQKGCTSRLQIRFARFGPLFGSARHGNADPAPARGTSVHSVDWSGAVCVRGFVFLGVWCLFQIGAGLSRVNMPPWVIACSSKRGAPTVFKCGLARFGRHFGSARHGNADPSPARSTSVHGVDSEWSGVCAWFCVSWSVLPD